MKNIPRIGSVTYLNAKPLIYGLEKEVILEHPSRLAQRLAARDFDTGIVPVVEVLGRSGYAIIDGICIGCLGPVYSVLLAHRGPIKEIREVVVDGSSRTSAMLLRVLLEKSFALRPSYTVRSLADLRWSPDLQLSPEMGRTTGGTEAMMLIGDQAIRFHREAAGWQILDLGQAWCEWTGLPFVFAVWAAHDDYQDLPGLYRKLHSAKKAGLEHLEEIVARETEGDADFRRQYFARNVKYNLGSAEKKGIRLFQQYLLELGLLKERHDLRFVTR